MRIRNTVNVGFIAPENWHWWSLGAGAPKAAKGRAGQRDVMLAASRSRQKE